MRGLRTRMLSPFPPSGKPPRPLFSLVGRFAGEGQEGLAGVRKGRKGGEVGQGGETTDCADGHPAVDASRHCRAGGWFVRRGTGSGRGMATGTPLLSATTALSLRRQLYFPVLSLYRFSWFFLLR